MGSLSTNNDTDSCNSQSCHLSCVSVEFDSNTYYNLQQNFRDGTPCQGDGRCGNGHCQGALVENETGSWISENRNIVISVTSVVGDLIVIAILSCCLSALCQGRRLKHVSTVPPVSIAQGGGWGETHPQLPPPATRSGDNEPPQTV